MPVSIISVFYKKNCSNSVNGIREAILTVKSLSQIGISSYDKKKMPHWWFINFSCFCINILVFFLIGLMTRAHNLNVKD